MDLAATLTDALAGESQRARDTVNAALSEVEGRLTGESERVRAAVIGSVEQVSGRLTAESEKVRAVLMASIDEVTDRLSGESARVRSNLIGSAEEITGRIAGEAERSNIALAGAIAASTERLAEAARALENMLLDRTDAAAGELDIRAERLASLLQARMAEFANLIDGRGGELARSFLTGTHALSEMIEGRSDEIAAKVRNAGTDVLASIADGAEDISRAITERGTEASRSLTQVTRSLLTTLDEQGRDVVTALDTTNERVKTDVTGILEQLDRSNRSLQTILDQASGNLARIERSLAQQTGDFRTAIDRVVEDTGESTRVIADNVSALQSVSSDVLREIGRIAARFSEQTVAMQAATAELSHASQSFDGSVDERQHALEQLARTLADKSATIDQSMRGFSALIQDTLGTAERRARDVGLMLARSAETAANTVTEQIQSLGTAAEIEGDRTKEAIDKLRDKLIEEVNSSIGEAVDRFADATEEMRKATRAVGRELEEIRADLTRGVLDLPQETTQQAAAMRRVVSEQIKALNELGDIVARQSAVQDGSRSVSSGGGSSRSSTPPSGNGGGTALAERPAPRSQPSAPTPPASERGPMEPFSFGTDPRRGDSKGNENRERGWITDLLRRVSDEDGSPNQPPRGDANRSQDSGRSAGHTIESLNSLSVDIARAIDNDAFLDLWNRYRRGETNVFTRRLYTLQGQQTFDEIRRKYQRDAEFRGAVDRYIDHFRSLYDDAVRKDPEGGLAQTYLNSDTGKVYTMLAHASGKLS
jgi:hypothetical protein